MLRANDPNPPTALTVPLTVGPVADVQHSDSDLPSNTEVKHDWRLLVKHARNDVTMTVNGSTAPMES